MILSGSAIRSLGIISPCVEKQTHRGISYGLGLAGYDVRIEFDSEGLLNNRVLARGDFILASTIERFNLPNNVVGIVHDKSTWARAGLAVQNTVIEPGWQGYLTLEITNHGNQSVRIYRGSGIAQVLFHYTDVVTEGYKGKYQEQGRGPVAGILE